MADFLGRLPLSNRERRDESAVSGDRRAAIADALDEAARLLAESASDDAEHCARARRFLEEAGLGTGAAGGNPDELRALAVAVRQGRKRSIRMLTRVVRALLVLGDALAVAPRVDAGVTGAVALYAATTAPFDRRAALRGHTVRASDEEWEFGRGPVITDTGRAILRFVLALDDVAPRPLSSR
ncbi:hypothetical protein [Microbacterium binotii]|uniref:hypothetical protein n=1 Tax=Microbacterium binotii TaxID=462710 RepID=UPI001F25D36A|nr:hypothetical protein [Microbacterium binotii]UIN31649.1 hypothetical protein LXM64_05485 [Microbacterium binotii]